MTYKYNSNVIRFVDDLVNLNTISDYDEILLLNLTRTRIDNSIRLLIFFVYSLEGLILKSIDFHKSY